MTHSDGGKGSARRPGTITDDAWERTFGAKDIEPDQDDEDDTCSWCGGCGEGMYDGAACRKCHGTGVEPVEQDNEP